jgi:RimJ/RimL family protein N-acetyltransferase
MHARDELLEAMMSREPSKERLVESLPLVTEGLTIRRWTRDDVGRFAEWPGYEFPYEAFDLSLRNMDSIERDRVYRDREARPDTMILAVDGDTGACLAYLALHGIDWANRQVHNFGFRVYPHRCGQGVGTKILEAVTCWLFRGGMSSVSVDVAASNARAVRCYEKVGFVRTDTLWRDAADLADKDLSSPRFAFLRPHVRMAKGLPQLRFWLIELTATESRVPSRVNTPPL